MRVFCAIAQFLASIMCMCICMVHNCKRKRACWQTGAQQLRLCCSCTRAYLCVSASGPCACAPYIFVSTLSACTTVWISFPQHFCEEHWISMKKPPRPRRSSASQSTAGAVVGRRRRRRAEIFLLQLCRLQLQRWLLQSTGDSSENVHDTVRLCAQ